MNSTNEPWNEPASSAPERRFDPLTGTWHVLAPDRQRRPQEYQDDSRPIAECPFCRGHESQTTPTRFCFPERVGALPKSETTEDWQVRVVDNLFPCFVPTENVAQLATDQASGSAGRHEVIIESPNHVHDLTQLSERQVTVILDAYRHRFRSIDRDGANTFGVLFKNSGREAGMSRQHVHSQFVALPHVPPLVGHKLTQASRFMVREGRCVFCHLSQQSMKQRNRVVAESDTLVAFCPEASRTAYEILLVPKQHAARFDEIDDDQLPELASLLVDVLNRMSACLPGCAYNYIIHSLPFDTWPADHYHWHIEIIPRISFLAGLEWGTGLFVNTVAPETAAEQLRRRVRV